ncbi:MAG: polysaccharide pyruvyl transferase family protein [Deltaproteobacteria bacterium]|nr:polysaccharide pyruvyl transferase family protein [Deltaproteobacteria bacterium]
MNGWFSDYPTTSFPPSASIAPIFIGFHITNSNNSTKYFLLPNGVKYFKQNEPIGCRDKDTMKLLAAKGIKSFYTRCLTLTFPKREIEPKKGKVFIVDAGHIPIPESLSKQAIKITHSAHSIYGHKIRMLMAKKLLATYRDEANLIITTRLHCALPCIAMGIPVIFFGNPNDYRLSPLSDINIKINKPYNNKEITLSEFHKNIDWKPLPISIEQEKQVLKTLTQSRLQKKIKELT